MKLILACFLVAAYAHSVVCDSEYDEVIGYAFVRAIYEDSRRMAAGPAYASTKEKKSEVCFPEIGCFSQVDGPFSWSTLQPEHPDQIKSKFSLFTQASPNTPHILSYRDKDTLKTDWLDPSGTLAVITHGLNEDDGKTWIKNMKNGLFRKGYSAVIVTDWSNGCPLPFYGQAMVNSEVVGRELAYILDLLHQGRGLRLDNVHLIGYSLGAHLSGFTGKTLRDKLGVKIGRITGLDPAGPSFEDKDHRVHLSSGDASFVDVIHSSAGTSSILMGDLGIIKAIADVDFYPNGGKSQPGCGFFDLTCSHRRANELFIETLGDSGCIFHSYPCSNYEDFKNGKCQRCSASGCGVLGYYSSTNNPTGSFYLNTNKNVPYCKAS